MQASRADGADAGKCREVRLHRGARYSSVQEMPLAPGDGARLQSCTVGDAMVHLAPCVPWPRRHTPYDEGARAPIPVPHPAIRTTATPYDEGNQAKGGQAET